jgi:hypothetical protein
MKVLALPPIKTSPQKLFSFYKYHLNTVQVSYHDDQFQDSVEGAQQSRIAADLRISVRILTNDIRHRSKRAEIITGN